jgi:hypothetical protein
MRNISLSVPAGHEKYGEQVCSSFRDRLLHRCRCPNPDVAEPGIHEGLPEDQTVKSKVEYTFIIAVEPAVIRVKVSDAEITPRG